jgi:hypothetical protein
MKDIHNTELPEPDSTLTPGQKRVMKLAEDGCTDEEIAQDLRIDPDQLRDEYEHELDVARLRRTLKIREQMYGLVIKSNAPTVRYLYEHELEAARQAEAESDDEDAELRAMSDEELDEEIRRLDAEIAAAEAGDEAHDDAEEEDVTSKETPAESDQGTGAADSTGTPGDVRPQSVGNPLSGA